jgi:protein SCO1/2
MKFLAQNRFGIVASAFLATAIFTAHATPASLSDDQLLQVTFDQKLNQQVALDLQFRDEDGRAVRLGDYFGRRPVILTLGYFGCPMLCTLVLNGAVESLQDLKGSIGEEFEMIYVSIDPNETPELAAAKKQTYLKRYGRDGADAGWHFLTGKEPAIRQLADEVGFHYAYDASAKQFAHPSGLIILTPDGKVSRYFFGITFSPNELNAALHEANSGKISSPIERLLLLCFHYNPLKGKYGNLVMLCLRVAGGATVLGVVAMVVVAGRRKPKVVAS